jgi:hypothetical protein
MQPPPPRPTTPESGSPSILPPPRRAPNPDDIYPPPHGATSRRIARIIQQQSPARQNEYFVPKEGIDREVITSDITRYLGNDALVRPGNYANPQTRSVQQGYFITAYRNLTTAMIADIKADSERWDAERRQMSSRGQPPNGVFFYIHRGNRSSS